MASKTFDQLTELAAAPSIGDWFALVDTTAGSTKKLDAKYLVATAGVATNVTGGGTIALGGFTATIPATGTVALLATANVFAEIVTASKGIAFPATPVASDDVHTLDDYEEGVWTPAALDVTITVTSARYTKIGRVVHVSAVVIWPATANATQAQLGGLPFSAGVDASVSLGYNSSATRAEGLIQATSILFLNLDTAVTNANFTEAYIRVSGSYTV